MWGFETELFSSGLLVRKNIHNINTHTCLYNKRNWRKKINILKLYKKKQKAEYLKYREWAGKKDKGGCVADFHQGLIYLCDPWEPLSVCEMPQRQRTCAPVRCASSASSVCETETRSGGQGKDTRLGKLEGGFALTERPFSLGRHSVLVPLLWVLREPERVNSAGDRLWSQWLWVTHTGWNLAVGNCLPSWHASGIAGIVL